MGSLSDSLSEILFDGQDVQLLDTFLATASQKHAIGKEDIGGGDFVAALRGVAAGGCIWCAQALLVLSLELPAPLGDLSQCLLEQSEFHNLSHPIACDRASN